MDIKVPGESAEYRAARDKLLEKEIELRRAMEAVAVERRALPRGGKIKEDYVFDILGPGGKPAKVKLSQLFAPEKGSLLIFNFMFPRAKQDPRPGLSEGATAKLPREEQPCPSCTAFLNSLDRAAMHIEAGGFNLAVVAKTSLERLTTFARERGWKNLRLLSAAHNSFKRDYHSEGADGGSIPMMTVFERDGDAIRHFWTSEMTFAKADPGQDDRLLGTLDLLWNVMDLTREGRPSGWREQLSYHETPRAA